MRSSSLSDKLVLYILLISLSAIAMVSFYSFYNARQALLKRTFEQLTSVRIEKKKQIEQYFSDRIAEIILISKFADALPSIVLQSKSNRNDQQHIPESKYSLNHYLFSYLKTSGYFKGFYFASDDGNLLKINFTNPDSVFSEQADYVVKNLFKSSLLEKRLHSPVTIFDYFLDPELNEPRMFIAFISSEQNQSNNRSILLEIDIEAINKIMLENNPQNGLGESGEVYLVGTDLLMRSNSRFQSNSVLKTIVKTMASTEALAERESTAIIKDYRDIRVLSSFSKLNVPGLTWAIIAEIDYSEATTPIYRIRNSILFLTVFLSTIIFIVAYFFSRRITLPLIKLKNATNAIIKGDLNIELKNKSKDEIGQLTESFNEMTRQLKQKELELQSERVKSFSSMLDGQEKERQRLSRELHDGLGQTMIALRLKLEGASGTDLCKTGKILKEVKLFCDGTINEIRRISNDLMPAVLIEFGVVNAIKNLCDHLSESTGIKINYHFQGKPDTLDQRISTYLFRITQEAFNNIIKHSGASEAEVNLSFNENEIILSVKDFGKGFLLSEVISKNRNGIFNMKERVKLLNGSFEINSGLSSGTQILVKIPYKISSQ